MAIPDWADHAITDALAAVFAPRCVACRQLVGRQRQGPVCALCWTSIQALSPPWCDNCGDPLRAFAAAGQTSGYGRCHRCQTRPPHFGEARAIGVYAGPLRQIVHALKFRGHQSLGDPLGALMRRRGAHMLAGADAVVPVPLHPWRRLRRGFNQADALARALRVPVWRPLRRIHLGAHQADLRGSDRLANVHGAYVVRARVRLARVPRTVVLIDDVMTTGATLDACARALREAGVERVDALTAARTVSTRILNVRGPSALAAPPHQPRLEPRLSRPRH